MNQRITATGRVDARVAAVVLALLLWQASGAAAQEARTVIDEASRVMGVTGLNAIALAGTAAYGNIGQSRTISFRLASTTIGAFTRTMDFAASAMHTTGVAGAPAVIGNPAPGVFEELVTPADGWALQLDLWISPWGFLRGAAANPATIKTQKTEGSTFRVVTWTPPFTSPSGQSYRVTGYINAENLVERVETWLEHPIFGDMHVVNLFTNYQDVAGVKVPARIAQRRMGMETFVVTIRSANANPANLADLMAPVAPPRVPAKAPDSVTSEMLADGVYRLRSEYVALAVGLEDFVVVIGGGTSCRMERCSPQESEKLGQAILAETKRLFPGQPIRYIVNTHPHFDHAAVLPPFAA